MNHILAIRSALLIVVLTCLAGCSNISFNNKYQNVEWKRIGVAPFSGKFGKASQEAFMHKFGTSEGISFIDPQLIEKYINENRLAEEFAESPISAMAKVCEAMKCQAFVIGKINTAREKYIDSSVNYSSLDVKIYHTESLDLVGSSLNDKKSVFFGNQQNLVSLQNKAFAELEVIFARITNEKGFWTSIKSVFS
jgi:hypothetical protein